MGSGHILDYLLWQSGLHQKAGLLLICCLYRCPPWASPRLFHPLAALAHMHLSFPHPSCLPGHGSPCSSADWPHGVSRACISVGSCWVNRHPQMWSQSVLFIVAWEQALSTCTWTGESGLPTDLQLVHIALQPSKGVCLPCVRPQDLCVQYMARSTYTQAISPTV